MIHNLSSTQACWCLHKPDRIVLYSQRGRRSPLRYRPDSVQYSAVQLYPEKHPAKWRDSWWYDRKLGSGFVRCWTTLSGRFHGLVLNHPTGGMRTAGYEEEPNILFMNRLISKNTFNLNYEIQMIPLLHGTSLIGNMNLVVIFSKDWIGLTQ